MLPAVGKDIEVGGTVMLKRCQGECGEEYPLVFFRRNKHSVSHASDTVSYRPICLACEQEAKDEDKRRDRWRDSAKGKRKVATVMREFGRGTLRSGSKRGPKVEKPAQAKAIAMSEGRRVSRARSRA